jgi:hypothetical protein
LFDDNSSDDPEDDAIAVDMLEVGLPRVDRDDEAPELLLPPVETTCAASEEEEVK